MKILIGGFIYLALSFMTGYFMMHDYQIPGFIIFIIISIVWSIVLHTYLLK